MASPFCPSPAECSVGVGIFATSPAEMEMLRAAIAAMLAAGVQASSVHAIVGAAYHNASRVEPDDCTRTHTTTARAIDATALLVLCENAALLSAHPAWMLLSAQHFVGPGIKATLDAFAGCGGQTSTRPLCPPRVVRNAGLFATADLLPNCPEVRTAIASGIASEFEKDDPLPWRRWKSHQQALGVRVLNKSSAPPLATSVGPWCTAGIVTNDNRATLPESAEADLFQLLPLALAGHGPMHAAATASRDRRRAMARGRYNHTYARPTLLRTLRAMGVSNFTHPHGARRAVLYEYQGVDLYRWDATWR